MSHSQRQSSHCHDLTRTHMHTLTLTHTRHSHTHTLVAHIVVPLVSASEAAAGVIESVVSKRSAEEDSARADAHLTPAQKERDDGNGPAPKRLKLDGDDTPACDLSTVAEDTTLPTSPPQTVSPSSAPAPAPTQAAASAPASASSVAETAAAALVLEEPK